MTRERTQPRRIGLFTSGRQDWGILLPVARAVAAREELRLTVFVSGTHLLDAFGRTELTVRSAGFECVDVPMFPADAPPDTQSAILNPQSAISDFLPVLSANLLRALREHAVDVLLVLGDRIETLSASVMAVADGRFLAHVHGGDRARGDLDDSARHAITKLAHVHFAATQAAAERIRRLGESGDRIHMVGSPSLDGVLSDGLAESAEARRLVGLEGDKPFVVLLFHPCGLGDAGEAEAAEALCHGVADAGLRAVCLAPNADPGRDAIWHVFRDFSSRRNWPIVPTVERRVFLRLMADSLALVGNSSAGMVESAAVGAAVLNVGPRQDGREHSANVLHAPAERRAVADALRRLQEDRPLAELLRSARCVFGDGQASGRIAAVLAGMELSSKQRVKLIEY